MRQFNGPFSVQPVPSFQCYRLDYVVSHLSKLLSVATQRTIEASDHAAMLQEHFTILDVVAADHRSGCCEA